jgi:hypothetical protein
VEQNLHSPIRLYKVVLSEEQDTSSWCGVRVYPKVSGLSHNEIYAYNNKHWLRSNTKGYGGKTQYTDSHNNDTTAPSGRELYHSQLSLHAASPETFGHTFIHI